jgi:hypothetical protein
MARTTSFRVKMRTIVHKFVYDRPYLGERIP